MLPTSREVEVNVSVRYMYLYSREVRGVVARLRAECGSLSVHAVALAHTQVGESWKLDHVAGLREPSATWRRGDGSQRAVCQRCAGAGKRDASSRDAPRAREWRESGTPAHATRRGTSERAEHELSI
ncbi:unnamed protein product [Lampetra fluviatilis]